jgi:hypothetical protein
MTEALGQLGKVSRQYQVAAQAYHEIAVTAAKAKAAHISGRAQRVLLALSEGAGSHAKGETIADADDEVASLYRKRLVAEAEVDAARQQLNQLREQVANGRTFAASEREVDKIHSERT